MQIVANILSGATKQGQVYDRRILALGERFRGRLEDTLLDGALDYVQYNERGLAIELLCSHLLEYDVPVTPDEYLEFIGLVQEMGMPADDRNWACLKAAADSHP